MRRGKRIFIDARNYVPFEVERHVHVSKSDKSKDENKVIININDYF